MRILLEVLLPILLPGLVYLGWLRLEQRWAPDAPDAPDGPDGTAIPRRWRRQVPWLVLFGLGVLLAALVLGLMRLHGGDPVGGVYVPAHMEQGRLVPGQVVLPPSAPARSPSRQAGPPG